MIAVDSCKELFVASLKRWRSETPSLIYEYYVFMFSSKHGTNFYPTRRKTMTDDTPEKQPPDKKTQWTTCRPWVHATPPRKTGRFTEFRTWCAWDIDFHAINSHVAQACALKTATLNRPNHPFIVLQQIHHITHGPVIFLSSREFSSFNSDWWCRMGAMQVAILVGI